MLFLKLSDLGHRSPSFPAQESQQHMAGLPPGTLEAALGLFAAPAAASIGTVAGMASTPSAKHRVESAARGFMRGGGMAVGAGAGAGLARAATSALSTTSPAAQLAGAAGGAFLGDHIARSVLGEPSWKQASSLSPSMAAMTLRLLNTQTTD
jgi:hypothetical protein